MRLIHTSTYQLHEFLEGQIPPYAILSHTWSDREITFADWENRASITIKDKRKILKTCQLAKNQEYDYLWVDTVCIDKSSSAELSEAINSMFKWYERADMCYAYLVDVPFSKGVELARFLAQSRWFTRGWTLQELLAPLQVEFYSKDWALLGTKASLSSDLSWISGIALDYISILPCTPYYTVPGKGSRAAMPILEASVAERLSWLSCRTTTRTEDMAYCMLGILDINMPLLYGEGSKAFLRLQQELMKVSNDLSIFCWSGKTNNSLGFLAPHPSCFADAGHFIPLKSQEDLKATYYSMTNAGLSITLPVLRLWSKRAFIGVLLVESTGGHKHFGIVMGGELSSGKVFRAAYLPLLIPLSDEISLAEDHDLFISEKYALPAGSVFLDIGDPLPYWHTLSSPLHPSLELGMPDAKFDSVALLTFEPRNWFSTIGTFPEYRFSEEHSILQISIEPPGCGRPTEELQLNPLRSADGASEGVLVVLNMKSGEEESFIISSRRAGSSWKWHTFWVTRDDATRLKSGRYSQELEEMKQATQDPEYAREKYIRKPHLRDISAESYNLITVHISKAYLKEKIAIIHTPIRIESRPLPHKFNRPNSLLHPHPLSGLSIALQKCYSNNSELYERENA